MPRVSYKYIMTTRCGIPSVSEQKNIAGYLDAVTAEIDESITKQQEMVNLLNERKQIIINDVVTGKVKVS